MHVLITGGAGFIGSHLAESLLTDGHSASVLDNFDPFYSPTVKRQVVADLEARFPDRMTVVEGDIRSAVDVARALAVRKTDVVAHLAALAGVRPSCERPCDYADVNVTGTARVLEAAHRSGVRRFFLASSSSVYGQTSTVPFREDNVCGEPISPYAATKRAGELLCHAYAHLFEMRVLCARFFTVYGPRQRPDLAIYKFSSAIAEGRPISLYGDGSTRRDYTYVSDIVRGVRAALDWTSAPAAGYEVVNLGGAHSTSLIDLVRHLERILQRRARLDWRPLQPGDVPITFADTRHARGLLGYEPEVSLEEGLARFVAWFRADRSSRAARAPHDVRAAESAGVSI